MDKEVAKTTRIRRKLMNKYTLILGVISTATMGIGFKEPSYLAVSMGLAYIVLSIWIKEKENE